MKTEKKELILDAAEQLMLSGEKEISVNMIAKKAGIAKGGIYYYFKSKEEIIFAVIEKTYKKAVHDFIDTVDNGWTSKQKIESLFRNIMKKEFQDNHKNVLRSLHIKESVVINNYVKRIAIQEIAPVLGEMLLQGQKENIFTIRIDVNDVAEMIVAVLSFFLDATIFEPEDSHKKLKQFAKILNILLCTDEDTFNFISNY